MDRETAVRKIIAELRVDEVEAEFILALEPGEVEGDAVLLVEE